MTTPQSQLYMLSENINRLYDLFKGDEDEGDIMYRISRLENKMQTIMEAQQKQENLMNLIIKLMSRNENLESK